MSQERKLVRSRASSDLLVSQLTLTELQQELQRRVSNLERQRADLVEKLASIDRELASIKGSRSGPGPRQANGAVAPKRRGSKPGNRGRSAHGGRTLPDVLVEVFAHGPMNARDAADAALGAGYVTTSRNFANNVVVALNRDKRFEKKHGGEWALAETAESGGGGEE